MSSFSRKSKGDGNYYQHDDRGSSSFHTRRVSFKTASRQQGWDNKVRKYVEDGDVNMTSFNFKKRNNMRFNPMKGRGGANIAGRGGGNFKGRVLQESPSSWYKVTLCHGKKYTKPEVMKAIQSFIQPVPFMPIAVKLDGDDMTFYVDNYKAANAINSANLRLQMRDGWKMQIKVGSNMPFVELGPELKERIRQVMSSHYDAAMQHLDLSRFYAREEFLENDIFVPLNRQNMLLAVFQIIAESVPNLRSLNLSDNKIFSTEHFSMLKKHAGELKSLNLSKNRIADLSKLTCLQGLKLETLVLDDNPLCDKFQDQTSYVREVRKIFRSLLSLDGVDLPPPVTFDIEENQTRLPTSQGDFLCDMQGREFTRQFLEQYYVMYDNHVNRDALIEAYADNAQFSMNAFSLTGANLSKYITESRNLKKVISFERRTKLLHIGKNEIVRFLNTLPKSEHDLHSFTVDLLVLKPELITLCVSGMFREVEYTTAVRTFSRTFTLIHVGNGFKIVNDMIAITDASREQAATAFQPQPSTSINASPNVSNMLNTTPVTPADTLSPLVSPQEVEMKRQLVTELAMHTGMNLRWSEKCLSETDWNLNNAMSAFHEIRKNIPDEAFIK